MDACSPFLVISYPVILFVDFHLFQSSAGVRFLAATQTHLWNSRAVQRSLGSSKCGNDGFCLHALTGEYISTPFEVQLCSASLGPGAFGATGASGVLGPGPRAPMRARAVRLGCPNAPGALGLWVPLAAGASGPPGASEPLCRRGHMLLPTQHQLNH